METLKLRHQTFSQSLASLREAIDLLDDPRYEEIYATLRDSVIQRFEYTIDGFWKLLKIYMIEKNKINLETSSPREILREAVNANLISEAEFNQLIEAITDRNLTSHSYNMSIAMQLIIKIPSDYLLMEKIVDRLII